MNDARTPGQPAPIAAWAVGLTLDANGCIAGDQPCRHCSYNLRGLLPTDVCPDCGEAVVPGAVPLTVDGYVDVDAPCRGCGYNLRGLPENGRCPECGLAVGMSIRGPLLRFSDPDYVQKLRLGTKYILLGVLVGFLISFIGVALSVMTGLALLGDAAAVLASLLGWYGVWLLTARDPSGLGEIDYGTARRMARIAMLISVFATVATIGEDPSATFGSEWQDAVAAIGGLAAVIGHFARLYYLSKLALRVPDDKLAGQARFLAWALAGSYVLVVLAGLVMLGVVAGAGGPTTVPGPGAMLPGGGPPMAPGRSMMSFACIMGVGGVAMVIFAIWDMILLYRIGGRFREQHEIAEAVWRGEDPPPAPATS